MASKTKARGRKSKAKRPGKVREVLEHVLTGAALGAVKGVTEVIVPELTHEMNKNGQEKTAGVKQRKS